MHRSKYPEMFQHDMVNANWSDQMTVQLRHLSDNKMCLPKQAPPSSRLLFQSMSTSKLMSPAVEKLIRSPVKDTLESCGMRKTLVDRTKLGKLLSLLRSTDFAGEYDPEHHAQYLLGE